MTVAFTEQLDASVNRSSESEASFALYEVFSPTLFGHFGGSLRGPSCRYAKTLASSFPIPRSEVLQPGASTFTQTSIVDPCYWTPRLPFLYEFASDIAYADGTSESSSHTVGLRRWEVDGRSFRLERKRMVLRGAVISAEHDVDLLAARDAEVAIAIKNPSTDFLQQASEIGVMVVADTRQSEADLTKTLLGYTWQPSVALVIPEMDAAYVPHSQLLAEVVGANGEFSPDSAREDWSQVIVVELNEDERPPRAMQQIDKPLIAIRRGVDYSDLHEARAACDRLQAELAPEFDLAGYFVAP